MSIKPMSSSRTLLKCAAIGLAVLAAGAAQAEWKPTKPITFVVTGGSGGGADQMARLIQGITAKYSLSPQPMIVVIQNGGGGGQGFMDVKNSAGDAHKIMIGLSNIYTVPLSTELPFNWRDTTPLAVMALDQFVLWVNAQSPYKNAKDFIAAVKAKPQAFKMGGAGSKREDELVTAMIEQVTGAKFTFIPYKGGGEISAQLVGQHIDADPNNPVEHIAHWRAGQVRPLCVLDSKPMPFDEKIVDGMSWGDIPTCRDQGIDAEYLMLRAIFMPKGVSQEVTDFYVKLLNAGRGQPEWKEFIAKGAYKDVFITGPDMAKFLDEDEKRHVEIMRKADFLFKK